MDTASACLKAIEDEKSLTSNDITLVWSKVNLLQRKLGPYGVLSNIATSNYKLVLSEADGYVRKGKMLAITGDNIGSHYLLNLLAGKLAASVNVAGDVNLIDNYCCVENISNYVRKEDIFYNNVTVLEHIKFHANLGMRTKKSKGKKEDTVNDLIKTFGLDSVKNTLINDTSNVARVLSQTERRKVTILCELMKDPQILFLEDPFYNLDSYLTEKILKILKKYSDNGMTIVFSASKLDNDHLNLVDDVCLVKNTKVHYMGPRALLDATFTCGGFDCPAGANKIDNYSKIVSNEKNELDNIYLKKNIKLVRDLSRTTLNLSKETQRATSVSIINPPVSARVKYFFNGYNSTIFTQFVYIFLRSIRAFARDPLLIVGRILQEGLLAVLLGAMYYQVNFTLEKALTYGSVGFFFGAGLTTNAIASGITLFPYEIKTVLHEQNSHLYRSSIYYLTRTFAEFPMQLISNLVFTIIGYFMIMQKYTAEGFFRVWLGSFLTYGAAISYSYLISALTGNFVIAAALLLPMLFPMIVFGSFLLSNNDVPYYLQWVKYVSWFADSFDGFSIVTFSGKKLTCETRHKGMIGMICTMKPNGELVLSMALGVNVNSYRYKMTGLIVLALLYRLIGCVALVIRSNLQYNIKKY